MDATADTDAAWSALETWLRAPEWPPGDAAYLLVGLDPEQTHGPCEDHGLGPFWLPRSRPTQFDGDRHSLEQHTLIALCRVLRLVEAADPIKVRTPSEWLKWACGARLEPDWLQAAYARPELCRLLPVLPARKYDRPAVARTASEVASMGGRAKAERSPTGKARKKLEPRIDAWLDHPDGKTARALADDMLAYLAEVMPAHASKCELPSHETITRWIRDRRKARST